MSVTLWNPTGEINLANAHFRRLLALAVEFGFVIPEGVDDDNLVGAFTDEEAEKFAMSIAAAIEQLPAQRNAWEEVGGRVGARMIGPNENVSNLVWFGGQDWKLAEVARICAAGAVAFG
jgi:hypothetical protein